MWRFIVCLASVVAAQEVVLYDCGGFEGFSGGSLVTNPQAGWVGYALNGGLEPSIVEVDGDTKLMLAVPSGAPPMDRRKESRVVLRFPAPLPVTGFSSVVVQMDLTTDADANGLRHNFYFDFDTVPDKFLPDAQIVQDIGYVQMLRGGNQQNGQGVAGNGTFILTWRFDVAGGLADSWFGSTRIDSGSRVRLEQLIGGQPGQDPDGNPATLDAMSFALVSDLWTGPADRVYLDNVLIRATMASPTGLVVEPSSAHIRVGGVVSLGAFAVVEGGTVNVTAAATWTSDHPSVAAVTGGVVRGLAEGTAVVRASYGGFQDSCRVVVQGFMPEESMVISPRTLLLNYDPILEGAGGQRLHEYAGWHDPVWVEQRVIADLTAASHGLVRERLGQVVHIDMFPVKADGFRYTDQSYLACLASGSGWHQPDLVDYHAIIRDHDLARRVDWGQVDEVTVQGAPYFGYWESVMAGVGGYWCNSLPLQKVACSKIFVLMGYNYERADCILHPLGHRAESIMTKVYGSWDVTQSRHDWDRFGHNVGQSMDAACGTAHYPPNGRCDYDYANPTPVWSTAVDWLLNFPDLTDTMTLVSCHAWGGPEYQNNYFRWWFSHWPHQPGSNDHDGYVRLNNWWKYVFDFNRYPESGGMHLVGGPVPPAQPFPAPVGRITGNARDDWLPRVNDQGVVVWFGHDGTDYEIFALVPPSTSIQQVTNNRYDDEFPQLNTSGVVVWQGFDGTDYEIFACDLHQGSPVQLTNNAWDDRHPSLNSQGLVAWDAFDGTDYEIWCAFADGSGLRRVTDNHASTGYPADDVWPLATDAGRIVWCAFDGLDWEIMSANPDGSGKVNLSNNPYDDEYPAANPQGRVVWHSWVSSTNAEIMSADASGGPVVRLTSSPQLDWHPRINGAGRVVWMRLDEEGDWEIMAQDATGANEVQLTRNRSHDQYPVIDDGGSVYWQGFDGTDWEIYAWRGQVLQVTQNEGHDRAPWVSPQGRVVWHADTGAGEFPTSEIYATPAPASGDVRPDPMGSGLRLAPNPWNGRLSVEVLLRERAALSVEVYDLAGRRVKTLAHGHYPPGSHALVWDGTDDAGRGVAPGSYLVRADLSGRVHWLPSVHVP